MARDYSKLAAQARERYRNNVGIDMAEQPIITAPPRAKKAKYLRDVAGNLYLWSDQLAARGDLVAAFDPDAPEEFADDLAQIRLNRDLEIARERADAAEAARLEAQKNMAADKKAREEAELLAKANAQNLADVEKTLQQEREQHAKQMAEMQAQIDALIKQNVEEKSVKKVKAKQKPDSDKATS